jgi:hypothetical protein
MAMPGALETEERKQQQNRNVLRRDQYTVRSIGLEPPRNEKDRRLVKKNGR